MEAPDPGGEFELDSETPHIVIIDDHPMVAEALTMAIQIAAPHARLQALETFEAALGLLAQDPADLVLLDLDLGAGGEWAPLMQLARDYPQTPVAIVSATKTPHIMRQARTLGAAGYLKKSAGLSELGDAVRSLLRGELVFPAEADGAEAHAPEAADAEAIARLASLTPTQARVLDGLRRGLLNKQIAYELEISLSTTKAHMTAIFRKLGVQNRTQALLVARHLEIEPAASSQAPPPS